MRKVAASKIEEWSMEYVDKAPWMLENEPLMNHAFKAGAKLILAECEAWCSAGESGAPDFPNDKGHEGTMCFRGDVKTATDLYRHIKSLFGEGEGK